MSHECISFEANEHTKKVKPYGNESAPNSMFTSVLIWHEMKKNKRCHLPTD